MEQLPTAEEFFEQGGTYTELAIAFTKLHLQAQLKAILENAKWKCETKETYFGDTNRGDYDFESTGGSGDIYEVHSISVDKDSIINAYHLSNIK